MNSSGRPFIPTTPRAKPFGRSSRAEFLARVTFGLAAAATARSLASAADPAIRSAPPGAPHDRKDAKVRQWDVIFLYSTMNSNVVDRHFLWTQAWNARQAGARTLKIAMFDEVNEATAVFKVAAKRQDAPEQGFWLTLDADGEDLPSDWYLRLAREITRMFHGETQPSEQMPLHP